MGYLAILILLVFAAPLVLAFAHDFRFNTLEFKDFMIREKKKFGYFAIGVAGHFIINLIAEFLSNQFP